MSEDPRTEAAGALRELLPWVETAAGRHGKAAVIGALGDLWMQSALCGDGVALTRDKLAAAARGLPEFAAKLAAGGIAVAPDAAPDAAADEILPLALTVPVCGDIAVLRRALRRAGGAALPEELAARILFALHRPERLVTAVVGAAAPGAVGLTLAPSALCTELVAALPALCDSGGAA